MMHVLGVDPGNTGALALYDGVDLIVYDMPTITIKTGRKTKLGNEKISTKADPVKLAALLRPHGTDISACVEQVMARPENGSVASVSLGRSMGVIEGVLAALGIMYELVRPGDWKRRMEVTSDKSLSRQKASMMFPNFDHYFARAKDDGRAEAALLALYWWNRRDRLPH